MEGKLPKSCKNFIGDTKVPARPHAPESSSEETVLLCVSMCSGQVMRAWATATDQYADAHGDHS